MKAAAAPQLPAPPAACGRPERWAWVELLHGLQLYGAAGITSFGWAMCWLLGWSAAPWCGLWFCAALLVYNADRLVADPADSINVPWRSAALRPRLVACRLVALGAGAALVLWPMMTRDWSTLAAVLLGALFCLNYSRPLLGFRFKAVPLLKTLFAPSVVTLAVFALPWLHGEVAASRWSFALLVSAGWAFLLFNMTLCDLRDIDGDVRTGVRSLPVLLGGRRIRFFLIALGLFVEVLLLLGLRLAGGPHARGWALLAVATPIYLGGLLVALRRPCSEHFYEWWVEGMLFLPALALALAGCWGAV